MSQVSLSNGHAVGDFSVVGIGASAGGLDAYRKLLSALPDNPGMAFILVQHLDPTHESMIVELLADATKMPVNQAVDGMPVQPNQVYVIPPGAYLSVVAGALHLSAPGVRHGSRLPFDFLLRSLATEYGARAVAVILSGNGSDGTLGLRAIHNEGGLVIAQEPGEAQYDGMPSSAVRSGLVDHVLRLEDVPRALTEHNPSLRVPTATTDTLPAIVDFLRTRTGHDFTLYKAGTLRRRIERRMALVPAVAGDMGAYLATLREDNAEPDLLAADLLINVTSFFRDASVFALLNDTAIPDLVRTHGQDTPIRVWIAGCSSGEEAYSIAILFREQITALRRDVKLQIFASDVDAEAVALAREGFYPSTIEHDVSAERLSRFFSKETNGYRVAPELRSCVVFTVHDILLDPPFARLDLISCRNLMIYLQPEAQAKVISVFHFALSQGGLLLLGSAETVGDAMGRFATVAKPERLYRRIGQRGSVPIEYAPIGQDGTRARLRAGQNPAQPRHTVLAELCRRTVIECFAPAAILINRKHECLYLLGPTDRYLTVPAGHPSSDLLAMARTDVRPKLRAAIQQAGQTNQRVTINGGRLRAEDGPGAYSIDVQPLKNEGEDLLLICFTESADTLPGSSGAIVEQDGTRVVELERELSDTKGELRAAIRDLEISNEEQKIINEEALSVNEEHQSTNEELLTSKEELQSLNEELTALNGQLQETLERQRTTSNDLQNVLYSTDVATLFLDAALNIRFFTPATKALFNVIATDIGRPLTDLRSLAQDAELLNDAKQVLSTSVPVERDIDSRQGIWYIRRIFPYRTQTEGVEGVVITFSDITERRNTADALNAAKRQAEQANTAKSRFLAAASHDLRQPLQTLTLVQGLLAKSVTGPMALKLVDRMTKTLTTMSDMLNALLDINQIDAGAVHAEFSHFPINFLLEPIRDEFAEIAQAKGLKWRVVPSALVLHSDPRLLGQMLRNLVANAIKYTDTGTVLLGCRRMSGAVVLEVWDTGHGIPEAELTAIFDEYHQLENAAREQSRGLGLGLSIVQRLGKLLGHQVRVRSRPTQGSVFSIEIASDGNRSASPRSPAMVLAPAAKGPRGNGSILVVDDDPDLCDLLAVFLQGEGYRTISAHDGVAALRRMADGKFRPDLMLADFNLPNDMNGLQLTAKLRELLGYQLPVIILTGDISILALNEIAIGHCVQLNKPVKLQELTEAIQGLLTQMPSRVATPTRRVGPTIFVVDDDDQLRETIVAVLSQASWKVEAYASCEAFLEAYRPGGESCLLIDAYLPGMKGLELLQRLRLANDKMPAVMITGSTDIQTAVLAMKAGASDFIEKPIGADLLLATVARAMELSRDSGKRAAWRDAAAAQVSGLTLRQREVMQMVLAGHPSKNIAADLGISQRTVENHRAAIMKKTGSKSVPALTRLALAAEPGSVPDRG